MEEIKRHYVLNSVMAPPINAISTPVDIFRATDSGQYLESGFHGRNRMKVRDTAGYGIDDTRTSNWITTAANSDKTPRIREITDPLPEMTHPLPETDDPHPEMTDPHSEMADLHAEMTNPHPETADPHPEMTDPYPEMTNPLGRCISWWGTPVFMTNQPLSGSET